MDSSKGNEIIIYQPDETMKLKVRLENETVWLTQAQMAELFQSTRNNITLHIRNYYCPLNFKDSKNVWLER